MSQPIQFKTTIPNSISRLPLRRGLPRINERCWSFSDLPLLRGLLLIPLVLACFGLSPAVRAVTPAPDGGYPGFNTAEGQNALFSLTTGIFNTAIGGQALKSDTTGGSNTAVGVNALVFNTTGSKNTAVGQGALGSNTTSTLNVAVGFQALGKNTTGVNNNALGFQALFNNTTGSGNIALGMNAGFNLTVGNNNIDIGSTGALGESGVIRLGTGGTHTTTVLSGNVGLSTFPGFPLSFPDVLGDKISLWGQSGNHYGFGIQGSLLQIHSDSVGADIAFGFGRSAAFTERMRIKGTGPVGIGTNNPTRGKLEVVGSVSNLQDTGRYFDGTTNALTDLAGAGHANYSIFASNRIAAQSFDAISDARIKRIEGRSDAVGDLNTLMKIEVTNYKFKDTIAQGNVPQKKVIGQQVEQVYPQAVSQHTDVVPDIYAKATLKDGWVQLASDLKVGERVRLIGEKDEGIYEVLEVREGAFRTAFQSATERVFVYGREVKDFRTVDYGAITMLNVSATQQIKKEKDAEIAGLKAENRARAQKVEALEASAAQQEKEIKALTASLKEQASQIQKVSAQLELKKPAPKVVGNNP